MWLALKQKSLNQVYFKIVLNKNNIYMSRWLSYQLIVTDITNIIWIVPENPTPWVTNESIYIKDRLD